MPILCKPTSEEVPVRSIVLAALSAALLISIAACSGPGATLAPGATATPVGATLPPTAPPTAGPTQAPPPVDVAQVCAGQATYSPDAPLPSVAQDDTLNSRFPTQIDGQPVTGVHSGFTLQSLCYYATSTENVARFVALWPPGTAALISYGYAQVELDGDTVYFNALRTPGADPSLIFSHIPEFLAAFGGDPATAANTTVTTSNLAGKNVYVVTSAAGDVSYGYVSGDTIWSVNGDEATATKVFAAIQ